MNINNEDINGVKLMGRVSSTSSGSTVGNKQYEGDNTYGEPERNQVNIEGT
jgi:hypothetical protein